jgi:ankyrin repeat protein
MGPTAVTRFPREASDDANMTRKRKTYSGLLLLLLLLLPLGMTVAKTYRDGRQQKMDGALFDALKQKNTALVKSRLAEGADPNARDIPSDLALDTRSVWWRLWDRLSGKPLSTAKEPTALLAAISKNEKGELPPENVTLVNTLLDAGAAVNAGVINGSTVLHYAVDAGDSSVVQLLLARGARVNIGNDDGKTPLHWAAYNGNTAITLLLLAKGADVNARDLSGDTPLSTAALHNQDAAVELLLARGAQVNTRDVADYTPLTFAQMNDNKRIVNILKHAGATE